MNAIRGLDGLPLSIDRPEAPAPAGAAGFSEVLGGAIGQVDALQTKADAASEKLALGGGNLHETALALEKADVALKVLTRVRNKVVEAYNEVMRMSV